MSEQLNSQHNQGVVHNLNPAYAHLYGGVRQRAHDADVPADAAFDASLEHTLGGTRLPEFGQPEAASRNAHEPSSEHRRSDADNDVYDLDGLDAALDRGDAEDGTYLEVEEDNEAGLGDVDAAVAADAAPRSHRGGRGGSHRRQGRIRSTLSKLNPAELARKAHASMATGELSRRTLAKSGKYAGAVALIGAGISMISIAYASARGHDISVLRAIPGHNAHSAGHGTQPAGVEQGFGPAGETGTTPAHESIQGSNHQAGPVESNEQPVSYHRTAHANEGQHGSNVTEWSSQTIYDEAIARGLSPEEARALAHDQHNIDVANQAFYTTDDPNNRAVRYDGKHYLNAEDTYDTSGQHDAASNIVDDYQAKHRAADPSQVPGQQGGKAMIDQHPTTTSTNVLSNGQPTITTETGHSDHEGNRALAAVAGGLAAGVGTVAVLTARAEKRLINRQADQQAEWDSMDAEIAHGNLNGVRSHRAPNEESRHRRSRSRRRAHQAPAHPESRRPSDEDEDEVLEALSGRR